MSLTDDDRRKIVKHLDRAEAAVREAILATFSAFVDWLIATLKDVYRRVRDDLQKVWRVIRKIL